MDNPFVHPDRQGGPPGEEGPLDPDPTTHDDSWYVDVGGHDLGIAAFRAAATDVPSLRKRGRLIVVEGPLKCGKTSLINRCRDHLASLTAGPGQELWHCDQSQIPTWRLDNTAELLSAPELRRDVCRAAVFEADWLKDADHGRVTDALDKEYRNDVRMVYALMSRRLKQASLAEIVLPHSKLDSDETSAKTLADYDRMMAPGMIFFAERTITTPDPPPLPRLFATRGRDEPLTLRLANLDIAAIRQVVVRRLATLPATERPVVAPEVYTKLAGVATDKRTIAYIVETFRKLFAKRISGESSPPDLLSIQWAEVSDLLLSWEAP